MSGANQFFTKALARVGLPMQGFLQLRWGNLTIGNQYVTQGEMAVRWRSASFHRKTHLFILFAWYEFA